MAGLCTELRRNCGRISIRRDIAIGSEMVYNLQNLLILSSKTTQKVLHRIKQRGKRMETLLLLAQNANTRTEYLSDIVAARYCVQLQCDAEQVIEEVRTHSEEIAALVIDHPAGNEDARRIAEFVREANSYLFAVPILVLTDREHVGADEAYLDDTVLDLIVQGDSERVVLQRIRRTNDAINSFSFLEFSRMLKALPSLIYLKDTKARYVFCSQYWHHISHLGEDAWSIRGKTDMEIRKDPENARTAYERDLQIIASGKGASYVIEENDDGIQEFLQIIKEPVRDSAGKVRGIIAIINNVTEQEKLRRELKRKSVTDELTGLNNRMFYEEYIERIGDDAFPMGVMSADCDGLKTINDLYGHAVGDGYLRMAATLLQSVLPPEAVKIRTGGDEFLALLPHADAATMETYVEKLSAAEKMFSIKGHQLSVSVGTAVAASANALAETVACSDLKMYQNKKQRKSGGRSRGLQGNGG